MWATAVIAPLYEMPIRELIFDLVHGTICFFLPHRQAHKELALPIEWTDSVSNLDWSKLSALYRAASLGDKKPSDLQLAFSNSMFRCFACDSGQLVGAGRALADGIDCSYICDVAVLPSRQGLGLGKEIVTRLVASSAGHRKIILYATPGNEPFYARLGFKRMTTAMAIFEEQAAALERGLVSDT